MHVVADKARGSNVVGHGKRKGTNPDLVGPELCVIVEEAMILFRHAKGQRTRNLEVDEEDGVVFGIVLAQLSTSFISFMHFLMCSSVLGISDTFMMAPAVDPSSDAGRK
jgi:hypothetical protein